jgi:hypothetical protein
MNDMEFRCKEANMMNMAFGIDEKSEVKSCALFIGYNGSKFSLLIGISG